MIIDKKWLKEYCTKMRCCMTKQQEQYILSVFATEPGEYNNWTEQDIHEQVRKILCELEYSCFQSKVIEHE
jgi:hypothetical protein